MVPVCAVVFFSLSVTSGCPSAPILLQHRGFRSTHLGTILLLLLAIQPSSSRQAVLPPHKRELWRGVLWRTEVWRFGFQTPFIKGLDIQEKERKHVVCHLVKSMFDSQPGLLQALQNQHWLHAVDILSLVFMCQPNGRFSRQNEFMSKHSSSWQSILDRK